MKIYNANIVGKARQLRNTGVSSTTIAKQLHVGDSTVLRWCYDIIVKNKNKSGIYQQNRRQLIEKDSGSVFKDFTINRKMARLLISVLYHCEGTRHPKANYVCFTNSDPEMITFFLRLLREGFDIDNRKIRIHLQLHTTHNILQANQYWSKLLGIQEDQIYKPTITKPKGKRKRHNYQGTCSIRYYDFRILHEIFGV